MNKLAMLITTLMLSTFLLASCATKSKLTDTNWYLKSEFTWWEARPEYLLQLNKEQDVYQLAFSLTPDGEAYHLKIADKNWSIGKNCGAPKNKVNVVTLNKWFPVYCDPQSDPITPLNNSYRFQPIDSSLYFIKVKFNNGLPIEMLISKS